MNGSPSNAISNDVFPAPVAPIIKLILPFWKMSSSSTLSTNARLRVPPGVCDGAESLDQVNDAWRMPIASLNSGATFDKISAASGSLSVSNSSMSSVWEDVSWGACNQSKCCLLTFRKKSESRSSETFAIEQEGMLSDMITDEIGEERTLHELRNDVERGL